MLALVLIVLGWISVDFSMNSGLAAALFLSILSVAALYLPMAGGVSNMPHHSTEESLELPTPAGPIKIPAHLVSSNKLLMCILGLQLAQAWYVFDHGRKSEEAFRAQAYILSLTPEQKAQLNLIEPDIIKSMRKPP